MGVLLTRPSRMRPSSNMPKFFLNGREEICMITEKEIREALATVKDPELGVNIVELGLIYGIEIEPGEVQIERTATSMACPIQEVLACEAGQAVYLKAGQEGLKVHVELVYDPPWSPEIASPEARKFLGIF